MEAVKFGMYSCNWVDMNLQFKKLLLLSIQMEDAHKLIIKFSPKRIVNMHLFVTVGNLT